ncbi:MAG: rhodanese-like domain-containing protein [Burkholderiaceae bacterium]|nr:rhodanese-like domain-containing protein [Burkholderiaceae bacterium]
MEFFLKFENMALISVALISGGMLLYPLLQRGVGAGTASLDTLGATRLINDNNPIILDVRTPAEYSGGHLPNARNIPLVDLEKRVGELPAKRPVLLCCANGTRSARAAKQLKQAGRDDVFNLGGGLQAWQQAGLPVAR